MDAGKSIDLPSAPAQSAEAWLDNTRCPTTGLQLLGGYPYQGSYQIAANLTAKWFEGEELKIVAFPLSSYIVDMLIPMIQATQLITRAAKRQAMKDENEKQQANLRTTIFDAARDACLPANFNTDSQWIQDRVRMMERVFNQGLVRAFRDQGLQTIPRGR